MTTTRTRESPHPFVDDPDTPDTCKTCHRADPKRRNRIHQLPATPPAQAEHRRRAGESEDE